MVLTDNLMCPRPSLLSHAASRRDTSWPPTSWPWSRWWYAPMGYEEKGSPPGAWETDSRRGSEMAHGACKSGLRCAMGQCIRLKVATRECFMAKTSKFTGRRGILAACLAVPASTLWHFRDVHRLPPVAATSCKTNEWQERVTARSNACAAIVLPIHQTRSIATHPNNTLVSRHERTTN